MRITHISVKNFCSYPELEFSLTDQGLTLISGPNGVGKSTLCDVLPWILYGVTSKGGKVDEVCSWNAKGPTEGVARFDTGITISRTRNPNDVFYSDTNLTLYRGRDLADTQKIINQKLGMDIDLFLAGSYFHEFCQSAKFFTTSAKDRRVTTEQIADLSLSNKISKGAAEYKKSVQKLLQESNDNIIKYTSVVQQLQIQFTSDKKKHDDWEVWHKADIQSIQDKADKFEENKVLAIQGVKDSLNKKIISIQYDISSLQKDLISDEYFASRYDGVEFKERTCKDDKCSECGAPKDAQKRLMITKERHALDLEKTRNDRRKTDIITLEERIKVIQENETTLIAKESSIENTYEAQLSKLFRETNPYDIIDTESRLTHNTEALKEAKELNEYCKIELSDIELLSEINDNLRMAIISRATKELEASTNKIFEDFFNGEIRVAFHTEASDKIEIDITKDGNQASYTQLSKGQRALLKLAFGISVMKTVANHHGLSFNVLMFDEALDGLSEASKQQAFKLFSSLEKEHETILVIDHSEGLKAEFHNRYEVESINGNSRICPH